MKDYNKWVLLIIFVLLILVGFFYFGGFKKPDLTTGYATSTVGNLSVGIQTYIACSWSTAALNVSFGSNLDPGISINATGNNQSAGAGTKYNMTVSTLTTANVNLTILGDDLDSSGNLIGIGNITYDSNQTSSNGANMIYSNGVAVTKSAVAMESGLTPGSNVHYRFWIDIPTGTVAGNYVGNYTQTCIEA